MSWRINLIDNSLEITKKTAKKLFKESENQCDGLWYDKDDVINEDGFITFNSDHMEYMDYLWKEEYIKILIKDKAKGVVTFCDFDGDNYGTFWGYEFDGKGKFKKLKGKLSWENDV